MRIQAGWVLLVLATALTPACDKVYFARLDIGGLPPSPGTAASELAPLNPDERGRAISEFNSAAADLGLTCSPDKYPMIGNSYDTSRYRLSTCRAVGQNTLVQLAVSDTHVTVELQQIGGLQEPSYFRECRTLLSQRLRSALGDRRVLVRYPYRPGNSATGPEERSNRD